MRSSLTRRIFFHASPLVGFFDLCPIALLCMIDFWHPLRALASCSLHEFISLGDYRVHILKIKLNTSAFADLRNEDCPRLPQNFLRKKTNSK